MSERLTDNEDLVETLARKAIAITDWDTLEEESRNGLKRLAREYLVAAGRVNWVEPKRTTGEKIAAVKALVPCYHRLFNIERDRWQCSLCKRMGTMREGMIDWDRIGGEHVGA